MEEALRAALLANAGVAALIARRLDWGLRPEQLPGGRMQVVSKAPIRTYSGRANLTPYRVQIDCFGSTYGQAKQVARAIEAAVEGLKRPAWDACFVEGERDDQDADAAGNPVHRATLDLRIWHKS